MAQQGWQIVAEKGKNNTESGHIIIPDSLTTHPETGTLIVRTRKIHLQAPELNLPCALLFIKLERCHYFDAFVVDPSVLLSCSSNNNNNNNNNAVKKRKIVLTTTNLE